LDINEVKPAGTDVQLYVFAPTGAAPRVVLLPEQIGLLAPASAAGNWLNVITTSSVDAVHGAFDIVHRNVYVFPATPVNVDVLLAGVVTVPPTPATMLHAPTPMAGALAARVTVVNPQVAALI
jgi:hypothetical protein